MATEKRKEKEKEKEMEKEKNDSALETNNGELNHKNLALNNDPILIEKRCPKKDHTHDRPRDGGRERDEEGIDGGRGRGGEGMIRRERHRDRNVRQEKERGAYSDEDVGEEGRQGGGGGDDGDDESLMSDCSNRGEKGQGSDRSVDSHDAHTNIDTNTNMNDSTDGYTNRDMDKREDSDMNMKLYKDRDKEGERGRDENTHNVRDMDMNTDTAIRIDSNKKTDHSLSHASHTVHNSHWKPFNDPDSGTVFWCVYTNVCVSASI